MPDYKRKKLHKTFRKPKKPTVPSANIPMSSSKIQKTASNKEDIKVVRGNKLAKRRRAKATFFVITAIVFICIILSIVMPVSLYENIVNGISLLGNGTYPADINGSVVLDTQSTDSYYYVLTDTTLAAHSKIGKKVFAEQHGFSNPILKISDTRALLFDQGGNEVKIYNLSGIINTLKTDFEIINASISRSGAFAVVTHSDNYASIVDVYNKKFKKIYNWNSAKNIVNNVLLNKSGNKIAVSTINASGGQYISQLSVLNYESADPVFSLSLDNTPALALENCGNGFGVVTTNKYRFVNWSKFTTKEVTGVGEINVLRTDSQGTLLIFNRANDRSDNTAVIISKRGEKVTEFKIEENISDIRYSNGRIYCISETNLNILSKKGQVLRKGNCNYGCKFLAVVGSNSVAVVTDTQIYKAEIHKGE